MISQGDFKTHSELYIVYFFINKFIINYIKCYKTLNRRNEYCIKTKISHTFSYGMSGNTEAVT